MHLAAQDRRAIECDQAGEIRMLAKDALQQRRLAGAVVAEDRELPPRPTPSEIP